MIWEGLWTEEGRRAKITYDLKTTLGEQWAKEEDLARHKEAKAFTELYVPKVIPLVERNPHLSDLVWP